MITKSDYITYQTCSKNFWADKHIPEQAAPLDLKAENNIETGIKVGELAKQYFKDTLDLRLIIKYPDVNKQVEQTKLAMQRGQPVIAEASFIYEDLFCAVDLLKKESDGSYSIYEVKAVNNMKEINEADVAFQFYVLKKCGFNIKDVYIMHLNADYVRMGDIDVHQLFVAERVTDNVKVNDALIVMEDHLNDMRSLIKQKEEPAHAMAKTMCSKCPYHDYCHRNIPTPSVLSIYKFKKPYDYINRGIYTLEEAFKDGYVMEKSVERNCINAFRNNKEYIDLLEVKKFLATVKYPLYHLDFETMNEAIPPCDYTHPYQQVPFQYSLHIEKSAGGELEHREFLGEEIGCQRALAEQLCKDIPLDVTSMAYNYSFEKTVIRNLAAVFPDLADHLMNIHDHMIDLMVPFQKGYFYSPKQGARYSIKVVMPALCPEMEEAYHNLPVVHNGGEALAMFPHLIRDMSGEEYAYTRKGMLMYCELDTLSMVKVLNALIKKVEKYSK